jgi:hypothetical protein
MVARLRSDASREGFANEKISTVARSDDADGLVVRFACASDERARALAGRLRMLWPLAHVESVENYATGEINAQVNLPPKHTVLATARAHVLHTRRWARVLRRASDAAIAASALAFFVSVIAGIVA